ncbi:MAG: phenol hydroxylase subunit [Rugosibacter sp.]
MTTTEGAALTKKYVRIIERRADGFIEFQFSIGYTEYYVELILSPEDFEIFCKENQVEFLSEGEQEKSSGLEWSVRDVAKRRTPQ